MDWHALLAGETPTDAPARTGGQAATSPSTAGERQPMTRREAREAEQRRTAVVEPQPQPHAKPSRSDRRAAASGYDHHDEPDAPKRRGPWGCLIGLLVVAALGAGAFFFLQGPVGDLIERFTPAADYSGEGTGEVVFMIHDGDTGADIAENLVDEGVTASYDAFYDELLAEVPEPEFHPGAYLLAKEMSARAALDALLDPSTKLENTVLIREGAWARDALAEASTVLGIPIEELQAAAANPQALGLPAEATSVEGFLFPATYTFDPGVTAAEVVQIMVAESLAAFDAAGVAPEDRYRVATVASLIEREGLPQDFTKVSRVIQNRLDQGMPLQFDSTVHYGLGDHSVVTTTDAQRADAANPYNTYVHQGLPPGPIGNPGAEAIQAALNPADGPWLYFVTVNPETGETVFTSTLEEHEAAAEQFYQWLEEHPEYGQ
ncbi:MAG TPA: endolytic transglycosylase MltG [Agromyces sp.]|nr:endolytic transglycosylase MltG [Agromyces sp.]